MTGKQRWGRNSRGQNEKGVKTKQTNKKTLVDVKSRQKCMDVAEMMLKLSNTRLIFK